MKHVISIVAFMLYAFSSLTNAAESCEEVVVGEQTVYYGTARCYVSEPGLSCPPLTRYSSGWESPTIFMSGHVSCTGFGGGWHSILVSCNARLPNSRIEQITEDVCEDIPTETVARARVNSNDMSVYDQSCYWGGWRSYTMVKQNELHCDGARVATVTDWVGEPYTGDCSVSFHNDNYTRRYPGSSDICDIRILRYLE